MIRHRKFKAIAVFFVSLVLFAIQAGLWVRYTDHARNETDKQNLEERRPPNEMAGMAGMLLLIAAAVVASIPQRPIDPKPQLGSRMGLEPTPRRRFSISTMLDPIAEKRVRGTRVRRR